MEVMLLHRGVTVFPLGKYPFSLGELMLLPRELIRIIQITPVF
jgi:hypothetical protein